LGVAESYEDIQTSVPKVKLVFIEIEPTLGETDIVDVAQVLQV
jgi:hypothetical protein